MSVTNWLLINDLNQPMESIKTKIGPKCWNYSTLMVKALSQSLMIRRWNVRDIAQHPPHLTLTSFHHFQDRPASSQSHQIELNWVRFSDVFQTWSEDFEWNRIKSSFIEAFTDFQTAVGISMNCGRLISTEPQPIDSNEGNWMNCGCNRLDSGYRSMSRIQSAAMKSTLFSADGWFASDRSQMRWQLK